MKNILKKIIKGIGFILAVIIGVILIILAFTVGMVFLMDITGGGFT